jgi:hypothetical protein
VEVIGGGGTYSRTSQGLQFSSGHWACHPAPGSEQKPSRRWSGDLSFLVLSGPGTSATIGGQRCVGWRWVCGRWDAPPRPVREEERRGWLFSELYAGTLSP